MPDYAHRRPLAKAHLEAGVADGGVAREDAVALQALIVGTSDLVEAGQRAREACVVVDAHPRVIAAAIVVKEVPRARVLLKSTHPNTLTYYIPHSNCTFYHLSWEKH